VRTNPSHNFLGRAVIGILSRRSAQSCAQTFMPQGKQFRAHGPGRVLSIIPFCLAVFFAVSASAQSGAALSDGSTNQESQRGKEIQNPIGSQTTPGQDEPIAKRIAPTQASALDTSDDFQISQRCSQGKLDKKACKFHWGPAFGQLGEFLAIETGWNLATNYWIRYETFHGPFFQDYFDAVGGFGFSRWNDQNPFIDDYVGHPMMGAVAMDIYIQNDPRGKSLELQNTRAYWRSRLRALLWSALYSAEWKLGPISEASIGNTGRFLILNKSDNRLTTETGTVGLVVTPVGGWVWSMAEDVMDEHVIVRLERKSQNPLYLFSIQFLNPCRGFSNLLRFKAPWYRDSRAVRRSSKARAP